MDGSVLRADSVVCSSHEVCGSRASRQASTLRRGVTGRVGGRSSGQPDTDRTACRSGGAPKIRFWLSRASCAVSCGVSRKFLARVKTSHLLV